MTVISESVRSEVVARAKQRCEYCQLPLAGQVAPFPVDHIVPQSRGGKTILSNLALACPHCNSRKWAHVDGTDPDSGEHLSLFNPRRDDWSDHFRWSPHSPLSLEGTTPCGRATVDRLQMNHSDMVTLRRFLTALGIKLSVTE